MHSFLLQADLLQTGNSLLQKLTDSFVPFIPKIIGALAFYLVGSWIIGKLSVVLKNVLTRKQYDPSLQSFLVSLTKIILTVLLVISIFGILGVDTTAFAALLVGAGVAIGSALNGTLGNFAGGIMMLVFKPFKIGDLVEAQGVTGTIIEQGVFATTLVTPENKTVIVPNGPLSTGIITNYTTHGFLRVDMEVTVDSSTPLETVRTVIFAALKNQPKVLTTPAPEVNILKSNGATYTLAVRPYCQQPDYWAVFFQSQEQIKQALDKEGIVTAVPQRIIVSQQ